MRGVPELRSWTQKHGNDSLSHTAACCVDLSLVAGAPASQEQPSSQPPPQQRPDKQQTNQAEDDWEVPDLFGEGGWWWGVCDAQRARCHSGYGGSSNANFVAAGVKAVPSSYAGTGCIAVVPVATQLTVVLLCPISLCGHHRLLCHVSHTAGAFGDEPSTTAASSAAAAPVQRPVFTPWGAYSSGSNAGGRSGGGKAASKGGGGKGGRQQVSGA